MRCYCIYIKLIVHFNGKIASGLSQFFLQNYTNTLLEYSKMMFAFRQATGRLLLPEVTCWQAN